MQEVIKFCLKVRVFFILETLIFRQIATFIDFLQWTLIHPITRNELYLTGSNFK